MLLVSKDGGPPLADLFELEFGFIKQGKQVMGNLRDKDVQHLNAEGSLVSCNGWWSSPTYARAANYYGPPSRNVSVNNTTYSNVASLALWGIPTTFSFPITRPRYFCVSTAKWVKEHTLYLTVSYIYDDDRRYGMAIVGTPTGISQPPFSFEDGTTTGIGNYTSVRFFTVAKPLNAGKLWSTAAFQVSWDAGGAYISVGGTKRYVKTLVPEFRRNGFTGDWWANQHAPVTGSSTFWEGSDQTVNDLQEFVQQPMLSRLAASTFTRSPVVFDWSTLTTSILSQHMHVDTSLLVTLFTLTQMKGVSDSWKDIAVFLHGVPKKLRRVKTAAKMLRLIKTGLKKTSNTELSTSYGLMPNERDLEAVAVGLHALARYASEPARKHARHTSEEAGFLGTPIKSTNVLTVESEQLSSDFLGTSMQLIRAWGQWGMYPTASDLWDVVPFSFAIDWFVNFGSVLDGVDANVGARSTKYYPIKYCIYGSKREWSPALSLYLPASLAGVSGSITFTWYDRYLSTEYPAPSVKFDEAGPFRSWTEAGALIIQRWK